MWPRLTEAASEAGAESLALFLEDEGDEDDDQDDEKNSSKSDVQGRPLSSARILPARSGSLNVRFRGFVCGHFL